MSDYIFQDKSFKIFREKRINLKAEIVLISWKIIFQFLSSYPQGQDKLYLEQQFDCKNAVYMEKIHPYKERKKRGTNFDIPLSVRSAKKVPEIYDISSGSESSDLEVIETEGPIPQPKEGKIIEYAEISSSDDDNVEQLNNPAPHHLIQNFFDEPPLKKTKVESQSSGSQGTN